MSWQDAIKKNRNVQLKQELIALVDKDIQYIDSGQELNPRHMKARLNLYKGYLRSIQ